MGVTSTQETKETRTSGIMRVKVITETMETKTTMGTKTTMVNSKAIMVISNMATVGAVTTAVVIVGL